MSPSVTSGKTQTCEGLMPFSDTEVCAMSVDSLEQIVGTAGKLTLEIGLIVLTITGILRLARQDILDLVKPRQKDGPDKK
jgi:hypothetical protein